MSKRKHRIYVLVGPEVKGEWTVEIVHDSKSGKERVLAERSFKSKSSAMAFAKEAYEDMIKRDLAYGFSLLAWKGSLNTGGIEVLDTEVSLHGLFAK